MKNNSRVERLNAYANWLFSEEYFVRFFRFLVSVILIWGLVSIWVLFFESYDNLRSFFVQTFRYIIAPVAAIISAIFLGGRYVQEIYELENYGSALKHLLVVMFEGPPFSYLPPSGLFLPELTVSDGAIKRNWVEENLVEKIGGPGWLYIESGNIVVLERLERKSMVLGEGMHYISRFEHVKDIISLEDQRWEASPIIATTRDGFEICVNDFQFGYRLAAEQSDFGFSKRSLTDPYPYSVQAAQVHAYERSVTVSGEPVAWGSMVHNRLSGIITEYINKNFLDQITAPVHANDDPRSVISQKMDSPPIRIGLKSFAGAELLWKRIGSFEVEPIKDDMEDGAKEEKNLIRQDIKDQRLKAWLAQWTGAAAVIRARGTAEKLSQEEGGRAETTSVMLQSIMQALNDSGIPDLPDDEIDEQVDENMWNIVLARTAQVLESLTSFYGKRLDVPDLYARLKDEKLDE